MMRLLPELRFSALPLLDVFSIGDMHFLKRETENQYKFNDILQEIIREPLITAERCEEQNKMMKFPLWKEMTQQVGCLPAFCALMFYED